MSFFTALYTLLIGPLELFFEILYSQVNRILQNPGLSIVFLSLVMNFLVLPLYKRADAMQEEERETDQRLSPTVKHIKKAFSGDERFMILQTFYRENHYKPTDALKGSVSLLLEIPFFMAAYNFLSGLPILHGASFGPIQNLGVPDGLLVIGGVAINVLPVLMTAINLVSSAIYTKGSSFKSKLQLYVMAGLFLILLYDSPSGLVFYWTLNNLFSLFKNIFMKLKNPRKIFGWLASAVGVAGAAWLFVQHPGMSQQRKLLVVLAGVLCQVPAVSYYVGLRRTAEPAPLSQKNRRTFWACGVFLTVLAGMLIPAGVINASPEEFLNTVTHESPLLLILHSTLTAAGFFLVWFGIFYLLANDSGKKWMSYGMSALCVIAVVDFMFFGKDYGNMSADLIFDTVPVAAQQMLNLLVLAAAAAGMWLLWKKKQEIIRFAALTAALAAAVMSVMNMTNIHAVAAQKTEQLQQLPADRPVIPLSRDGRNVIVLMLDRGVGGFVPFLMNEKPELQEQFAGFTYYPNTISYGGCTNFGAPGLFGGYEYIPEEMNRRDTESLESKHNEALSVMPVSFLNQGFEVTVFDPPCAGYDWIPDVSIYDDYPGIHASNSMGAFRSSFLKQDLNAQKQAQRSRNFFCYSAFKMAPVAVQPYLYDGGQYNDLSVMNGQTVDSISRSRGFMPAFMRAYAVLENLENMTEIREGGKDTFLMMTNDTTHEPALLQEPEYVPAEFVDNTDYDAAHQDRFHLENDDAVIENVKQMTHYHANMAAFLKVGQWLDYLREQDVYDNTRIIIVSDHGWDLGQMFNVVGHKYAHDMTSYHPILMVKDFGSTEYTVDSTFMTNADTVLLAMEGVVEDLHNPFTGKLLEDTQKQAESQHLIGTDGWDVAKNNGNTFLPDDWFSVHDNVFDPDNWAFIGVR